METVKDIIGMIRFAANQPNCVDRTEALNLADRLDAAYRYELIEKYSGVVNEREKEIEKLLAENKTLREREAKR